MICCAPRSDWGLEWALTPNAVQGLHEPYAVTSLGMLQFFIPFFMEASQRRTPHGSESWLQAAVAHNLKDCAHLVGVAVALLKSGSRSESP